MCELCNKKILRYINEHEVKDNSSFISKNSDEKESTKNSLMNNRSQHLRDLIAQD